MAANELHALVLTCTLKASPAASSSDQIGRDVLGALTDHGVSGEVIRVADEGVKFGVTTDEGGGDGWPEIRRRLLEAQLLVLATPIWLGQPSSVCKMVLERLDAELAEAMGSIDYQDLHVQPDKVADAIKSAAAQAAHLARLLRDNPYPPPS